MNFSHTCDSAFLYHRKLRVDCIYFMQYTFILFFLVVLGRRIYPWGEKSQVLDYFQRKEI